MVTPALAGRKSWSETFEVFEILPTTWLTVSSHLLLSVINGTDTGEDKRVP